MGIHATAGTKVGIGTTAPFATATEYAGDVYTPIAGITDVGESGPESEVIVRKHVDVEHVLKRKGSKDAGVMTISVDRDSGDVGYQALIAAEKSKEAFNFKVELADAPSTGASPKGSVFYFSAVIASAKTSFGGSDDIVSTAFALAISGPILEIAASAT